MKVAAAFLTAALATAGTPTATDAEAPPPTPSFDRAEIERTIRDSIGWALDKDRARLEGIVAHDADLFIFHPDSKSTVVGWPAFAKLFELWMDPRFKATHFDVRELRTHLSRAGDAAWFSAILDDCGEWAGKPSCWKDTRWTGVLEKRDGKWLIVQMHFSFAADKVRAEAQGSTTQ
jgi:ketosteroid isomerase-like protein